MCEINEGTGGTDVKKTRRGRPKINTEYTVDNDFSRRVELNRTYVLEGSGLFLEAGDDIPDSKLLYNVDCPLDEVVYKGGIVEQLGRLYVQDKEPYDICVDIANMAVDAFKNGATSRSIEKAIRAIRKTGKLFDNDPDNKEFEKEYLRALMQLDWLGKK